MMQQAQQSLANPNGGDVVAPFGGPGSLLPGPKELGLGALAGVGASGLFQVMDKGTFHGIDLFNGKQPKLFDKMAIGLDKLDIGGKIAKSLDPQIQNISQKKLWAREFLQSDALISPAEAKEAGNGLKDLQKKRIQTAVNNMENRHFEKVVENFRTQFDRFAKQKKHPKIATEYDELVKKLGGAHNYQTKTAPVHATRNVISDASKFSEGLDNFNAEMRQIVENAKKQGKAINIKVKDDAYKNYANFMHSGDENLQKEANKHWNTHVKPEGQGALGDLTRQFHYLEAMPNKNDSQKALCKLLRQTKESAGGVAHFYTPLYKSQAELTAELSAKGVGPVGRSARSFVNYIQRIMSGETAGMAGKGFLTKATGVFGPALMGALLFGFSFQSAKNAQPGERKQAFWHNLLGQQIFNFIGWEFGRKALYSMKFKKILGRFAKKTPLAYLRHIPFVGGMIGGVSLGGIATELTAMFIFGSLAQKVGEKISHLIFGKPSQASIDGRPSLAGSLGQKPPIPGQPQLPGQNQIPGLNQMPGQSQAASQYQNPNPALSGVFNPALMNPAMNAAMPQTGLQARTGLPGGVPQNMAYGPSSPGAGMSRPAAPQGMASTMPPNAQTGTQPAAPKAPAAPQAQQQPPQPQFSLTPAQISQSKVANDYNVYYSKLKADKSLDQRPGEILDKMDKP